MNKIVREHYPVSRLPEDIRSAFPVASSVTITVVEEPSRNPPTKEQFLAMILESQKEHRGRGVATEEAVARVRELRDEWDD